MGDARPSVLAALRRLLDTSLELAEVRLALLGTELEEQKLRVGQGLALALGGVLLLLLAVVLLCGFVLLLVAPDHRLAALGLLVLAVGGAGGWLLHAGSQRLRSPGAVFQGTLDELRRDRDALAARFAGSGTQERA